MSIATELHQRLTLRQHDWLSKSLETASPAISVGEMADYLGVHRNTVSGWLNGKHPIPHASLRLWAMRTGVPLEYLLYGIIPGINDEGGLVTRPYQGGEVIEGPWLKPVSIAV